MGINCIILMRDQVQGGGVFISEPEEIAMQAHLSYLDFIQQSQNATNTNKRNLNLIWDNFLPKVVYKKRNGVIRV